MPEIYIVTCDLPDQNMYIDSVWESAPKADKRREALIADWLSCGQRYTESELREAITVLPFTVNA